MQLYHFKGGDEFKFDAFIFAHTPQRAGELFLIFLVMNGENPDSIMWREIEADLFEEPDQSSLRDALALDIEGVASHDPERGWRPVPPFDRRENGD